MADAFLTSLFGADKVTARATVKVNNQVRSVTLKTIPQDVTDEAFVEAAKNGVDLSLRIASEGERTRSVTGRGVHGAAAVSAVSSVLGYSAPAPKTKGKPSANGVHPEPATVTAGMSSEGGSRI